jgi:hypothetical protein
MRFIILFLAMSGLAVFTACQMDAAAPISVEPAAASNTAMAGHDDHEGDDAPRITLADAKKDFDAGNAFFIDVRNASNFNEEHIAGAVNITKDTLAANLNKIPKGKRIIAYCS